MADTRGIALANAQLLAHVQAIAPATYHTSFTGVYTRLLTPEDHIAEMPYACLVFDETPMRVEYDEGNVTRISWRMRLYAFFAETDSSEADSDALQAGRFVDDMLLMHLKDYEDSDSLPLAGRVDDMTYGEIEVFAGILGDYSEVQIPIELSLIVDSGSIGP